MLTWACVLFLLPLSVPISCCSKFYYARNAFQTAEDCKLCYETECMNLDQSRCAYYAEADGVLPKDDDETATASNPKLRREVDDLVFELVDKVAGLSNNMECIPYVSRYTNCNKDNICLGCKTCACNADGRWQCTVAAPCHSKQPPLKIDHRVLGLVMGSLIESAHSKKVKRSVVNDSEEFTTATTTLSLKQIADWFYGVQPIGQVISSSETPSTESTITEINVEPDETPAAITETNPTTEAPTTTTATESKTINTDTDYLEFDEVLRSIAVDTKSYSRRKPLDNTLSNHSFSVDYIIFEEDNGTSNTNVDNFAYMINMMQDNEAATEPPVTETTKIVIDLLSAAEKLGAKSNTTEDYAALNKDIETKAFENMNDVVDYNTLNIMKRDVNEQNKMTAPSLVPVVTIIVNTTNDTRNNHTGEPLPTDLKETVLVPFNKIIFDKVKELENLKRIKDNLAKFIKTDVPLPEDVDNSTGNTYFSIYNLAMGTGVGIVSRRSNTEAYDKYTLKLKGDIFEVIRDITAIQRQKSVAVPDDLNYLLHSMKRYVYKNQWQDTKPKKIKKIVKRTKHFRRQMNQNVGHCAYISFKDCLIKILELVEKESPKFNALSPLSPTSRRIMKRIINSFYVDELAVAGVRVRDPNYNLTNDLQVIGSKWQDMSANIMSSTPFASLFRMKLLHFALTSDISKINDAISLIDFSHSRRMLPSLDKVNDDVIDKINDGLTAIHDKMQLIIKYYSLKTNSSETINPQVEDETSNPVKNTTDSKKKKNRSFITHIRSLLETSKKDIAELLHRKVPKSEIVKQLAKKKLDEISEKRYNEYEEAMKKWQKNLDVTSRSKRSLLYGFQTRIKNIIPGYLRHKVNPKIKKNATRFADEWKKKRMAATHERMRRRTTTPKTKWQNGNVSPKTTTTKSSTTTAKSSTLRTSHKPPPPPPLPPATISNSSHH
ncbi:uncharacterized protein LOC118277651 [Spodoptera frugiperda]|uniref:Uncharacterized protein LOC118277651 n=1 Tax=Spodoptera frugiperda TaxID=7108 RepID=A0A9R0DGH0_SPOFR|nr:uncharacterized protein LOC118277651 [Spodoptera frugiperda]